MPDYFIKICRSGHILNSTYSINHNNCQTCGKKFVEKCDKCGCALQKMFFSQSFFGTSTPVHPPKRPNCCPNCGKKYPWAANLFLKKFPNIIQLTKKLSIKVKIIGGSLILGIATILAIFNDGFGLLDRLKSKSHETETVLKISPISNNVTTTNQSGGIAANTVNIGAQERHINQLNTEQFESSLPSDKNQSIHIVAVMGDQEALQFATEIKEYLVGRGWKVRGVDLGMYAKPVIGQSVSKAPDGETTIIIGSNLKK